MSEQEQEQVDPLVQGEDDRQRAQAAAATGPDDPDPASPEGQNAAIRRGDPVQLQGDDLAAGQRLGTNTTHNESPVYPVTPAPGPVGHNFVTGALGEPIPAGEGVTAERPSVGEVHIEHAEAEGEHPDEPVRAPWEDSERERLAAADESYRRRLAGEPEEDAPEGTANESSGPPARSATKAEWVDHAVSQGADRDEAEAATKDELIERHGTEGPGVSA